MQYGACLPVTLRDVSSHHFLDNVSPTSEIDSLLSDSSAATLVIPETPSPIQSPSHPSSQTACSVPVKYHFTDVTEEARPGTSTEALEAKQQMFVSLCIFSISYKLFEFITEIRCLINVD